MWSLTYLVISVLIWRSPVWAVELSFNEVCTNTICPTGVDTCGAKNNSSFDYVMYGGHKCMCDAECNLFGECCVDRALGVSHEESSSSKQYTEKNSTRKFGNTSDLRAEVHVNREVLGIPRDRWGCQDLVAYTNSILPVKSVRMVVRCPTGVKADVSEKCVSTNRSDPNFHYTMDIPALSTSSGIWYRNVYCAICNEDVASLEEFSYYLQCNRNISKNRVLTEGNYSEPLEWLVNDNGTNTKCQLRTELKPNASSGFLRPCGKADSKNKSILLIEDCPESTDQDLANKCSAYTFYLKKRTNDALLSTQSSAIDRSTVLSQVYKNLHCALCNGVSPMNTTRWMNIMPDVRHRAIPSFSIIMDFMDHSDTNEQQRSCHPPTGVWDLLHSECIQVVHLFEQIQNNSSGSRRVLNKSCPTITLTNSEYQILDNGSLQFTGNNSHYKGHIFDDFEILQDETAIVCVLDKKEETEELISGASEGYLTEFCLSISVVCLVLHVGTYYALPKLCNLPGKNLLSLSWALLFAQLIFLLGINPIVEVSKAVCVGIAVVEYYCFLAAFLWMNVMSVDIWRTFSGSILRGKGGVKTHRKYAGYAWGTSALMGLLALTVDLTTEDGAVKPYFGEGQKCWFGNPGGLGLFLVMPLFILLLVNTALFANTVYRIWQTRLQGARYIRDKTRAELIQTSSRNSTDVKESIKKRDVGTGVTGRKDQVRFYLYMKLFIIMGLTWIFGFIAAFAKVSILWYPFIIFNGLQGAFIFVMFDLKRNIAYMLWDKYVSRHGYEPPGFLLASSSSSATKTMGSNKSKCRFSASANDKNYSSATTRTLSVSSNTHLTTTGTSYIDVTTMTQEKNVS